MTRRTSLALLTFTFMFFVELSIAIAAGSTTPEDFQARTFDDGDGHTLPYRLYVPRGVDPSKKIPLVLFLHGAGGRGTDNLLQLTDQAAPLVFVQPENQARWPVMMVAPQCPVDQQWVAMPWGAPTGKGQRPTQPTWPLAAAIALVERLAVEFPAVDVTQLYVTGMSMGGFGTFDAAARYPGKWRAAVPVCGGYDDDRVAALVGVPLWAFHAEDDPVVPVGRTRDVIAAIRAHGGQPRYTEYPASAHHGHFSWIPAYGDPELLPWMFGTHPTVSAGQTPSSSRTPTPARGRGCACASAGDQDIRSLSSAVFGFAMLMALAKRRRSRVRAVLRKPGD
jgi:MYXO-CTERM domain-containing protein